MYLILERILIEGMISVSNVQDFTKSVKFSLLFISEIGFNYSLLFIPTAYHEKSKTL